MNIIFYCQYVWGVGHLMRSLEFARSLAGHDVTLVAGGRPIEVDIPDHVDLVHLAPLYMDEMFTTLISGDPDRTVAQVQAARKAMLYELFRKKQADIFVVELYPFGRSIFGFELEPLLADIRAGKFGNVMVVCSLRDILVEKKDTQAYEARVIEKLNRYFDALLIHSDARVLRLDETFSRTIDIRIPVAYTGFIAQQSDPAAGVKLRRELGLSAEQKLVVASAGGGRSGYKILASVLDAVKLLGGGRMQIRLELFAGPFMENEEFEKLAGRAGADVRIRRYTRRFLDYLHAADLSLSLAGYNTCMNLLVAQLPALVYPYARQREQPLRVDRIKDFLPLKILTDADLLPETLSSHIYAMLQNQKVSKILPIDLNGSAHAAEFLSRLAGKSTN